MKIKFFRWVKQTVALFFWVSKFQTLHADELIVKTKEASVVDDPKTKKEILKVKQGDKLPLVSKAGLFWKVKLSDGKEGFISGIHVTRQISTSGSQHDPYATAPSTEDGNATSRTRKSNAVMGVRGLDGGKTQKDAVDAKPDYKKVRTMEEQQPDASEIQSIQSGLDQETSESKKK
jgi:hypothetical protein